MDGHKLRRDHGDRRCLFLADGTMLELIYDLNAVMRHEQLFELPLRGILDEVREELLRHNPKLPQKDLSNLLAAELVRRRLAPGQISELAGWAYCLTETDREDKEIHLTWPQFRRLLPAPPPQGAATKKALAKLKASEAWMMATAIVRAREEVDEDEGDEGNEQAAGDPVDPSASEAAQ